MCSDGVRGRKEREKRLIIGAAAPASRNKTVAGVGSKGNDGGDGKGACDSARSQQTGDIVCGGCAAVRVQIAGCDVGARGLVAVAEGVGCFAQGEGCWVRKVR